MSPQPEPCTNRLSERRVASRAMKRCSSGGPLNWPMVVTGAPTFHSSPSARRGRELSTMATPALSRTTVRLSSCRST
jgi:hypothetical protein